jgi:CRISPR/Cas system-associated exonuclease Cas4 (RecB family)
MRPFLESLAIYLTENLKTGSGKETRIILPNRRAGLFLQHHLSRTTSRVTWLPNICSIEDFIDEFSLFELREKVSAVLTLYDTYCGVKEHPEPLDEFYHWGEIILNDFDELDKYLVDAGMLFRNIASLKEIEEPLAGLGEHQLRFIRQFWEGFYQGADSNEKKQFREMWELLPQLYSRIRSVLAASNEGYRGMQYREITERIGRSEIHPPGESTLIIAGFNALNSCEKRIFDWLKGNGAIFFWDYRMEAAAKYGTEAARYMKENLERYPSSAEMEAGDGKEGEPEIRIFELPSDVLQAKTVQSILEKGGKEGRGDCTDTAVILCDEDLLMPVLLSLPGSVEEINVTMGYPMRNTPVSSLVEALFRLQRNAGTDREGQARFYHADVRSVLLHPYLESIEQEGVHPLLREMAHRNMITVEASLFKTALEKKIFRHAGDPAGMIRYFREIFLDILSGMAEGETPVSRLLQREFIFRLLIHLNKLEGWIGGKPGIPVKLFEQLFRKTLSSLRIPFEGEPLSGLQVMGILETRLLDFRHVILLSMNEEVMPAVHFRQSYIPYSLRLAFRMPSREDMDAIYAYYFARLMQRSAKVDLLFNSASDGVRSGEMSRYLLRLIFKQKREIFKPLLEIAAREVSPIEIKHTEGISRVLGRYTRQGEEQRYLSPSAINTYIDCPLKFYLRHIAGIKEREEVSEEVDAPLFGTVIHDAMGCLYNGIAGHNQGLITRGDLERISHSGRIEEELKRIFRKRHLGGRKDSLIEGRNLIVFEVMLRYIQKIIEKDIRIAPFTLFLAEETVTRDLDIQVAGHPLVIRLGGRIDRVDSLSEGLRVIDYKTGDVNRSFSQIGALFDPFLSQRNSAAFQTLFYSWLVTARYPGQRITPGLYGMRELYNEDFDPGLSMGSHGTKVAIISFTEVESEFLVHLQEVISRIYDPAIAFSQTNDVTRCRQCDFAALCHRDRIE